MDIKVTVGFDNDTKLILENFIQVLMIKTNSAGKEKSSIKKEIAAQDTKVELVPKVEEVVEPVEDLMNEVELRQKIKEVGIQHVQHGKSAKVKKLTAEYGCTKMDDLPTDVLEEYLAKLEKL